MCSVPTCIAPRSATPRRSAPPCAPGTATHSPAVLRFHGRRSSTVSISPHRRTSPPTPHVTSCIANSCRSTSGANNMRLAWEWIQARRWRDSGGRHGGDADNGITHGEAGGNGDGRSRASRISAADGTRESARVTNAPETYLVDCRQHVLVAAGDTLFPFAL